MKTISKKQLRLLGFVIVAITGLLAAFGLQVDAQSSGARISVILDAGDLATFDTGAPAGGLLLIRGTGFSEVQDNRVRFVYTVGGDGRSVEVEPLFCTGAGDEDVVIATAPTDIDPDVNQLGFAILQVSVTADGAPGANTVELRYQPAGPPTLSGCSPALGGAGTLVTIEGTNLGSFGLQPTVTFDSSAVPPAVPTSVPAISTGNRIYAIAPAGLPDGPATIQVVVPGQDTVTCPGFFEYVSNPAPQVVAVLPPRGTPGSALTIEGTNLSGEVAPTVNLGGNVADIIAWSDVLLLAEVPGSAAAGTYDVQVTAGGQTNSPGQAFFEVLAPGNPYITSVASPLGETTVPIGSSVLIEGDFLGNASYPPEVRIGGVPTASVPFGEQRVLAWVPYGIELGPANVRVNVVREGFEGVAFASEALEIVAPAAPDVFAIQPATGAPPLGEVFFFGIGFGGAEAQIDVSFNRGSEDVTPAQVVTHTPTTIRAIVPSDALTGDVEVSVEGSTPAIFADFPIVPAPEPFLDAQASDSEGVRGQTIRLQGQGLWLSGQIPTVSFIGNGGTEVVEAPIRTSGELFVVVPPNAESGALTVTVTVASETSNGITFTVMD
ncbi:MAG: IPT/TIG domain-containing protein [Planctomycetota bacterium]